MIPAILSLRDKFSLPPSTKTPAKKFNKHPNNKHYKTKPKRNLNPEFGRIGCSCGILEVASSKHIPSLGGVDNGEEPERRAAEDSHKDGFGKVGIDAPIVLHTGQPGAALFTFRGGIFMEGIASRAAFHRGHLIPSGPSTIHGFNERPRCRRPTATKVPP